MFLTYLIGDSWDYGNPHRIISNGQMRISIEDEMVEQAHVDHCEDGSTFQLHRGYRIANASHGDLKLRCYRCLH